MNEDELTDIEEETTAKDNEDELQELKATASSIKEKICSMIAEKLLTEGHIKLLDETKEEAIRKQTKRLMEMKSTELNDLENEVKGDINMEKYLVILLGKDAGADVNDIASISFKIVDATSPNEALAKWKPIREKDKSDPDSWYTMAMKVKFIENKITKGGKWIGNNYITKSVGKVYMDLSDGNTYDYIVVTLEGIKQDKEYTTYLTVDENDEYTLLGYSAEEGYKNYLGYIDEAIKAFTEDLDNIPLQNIDYLLKDIEKRNIYYLINNM